MSAQTDITHLIAKPSEPPRVLIDCDPGHDDVLAIAVAAQHCEILGITTVDGNSPLVNTTRNALIACDLFGLREVPVHSGASQPLRGPSGNHATEAHGKSGLDGPAPRTPSRTVDGTDAVAFIVETVRANEGMWLVPTGPLTNIALALRAAPDIVERVAGISLMGGSMHHGNVTSAAEFNIWFDPEAADEVFSSGASIRMCGLDLTHQVGVDGYFIDALRAAGTDTTAFCAELVDFYHSFATRTAGRTGRDAYEFGAPMHDPCAVMAITHPELFRFESHHIVVETEGRHTRGMTHPDLRPWRKGTPANTEVVVEADRVASVRVILESVLQH